MTHIEIENQVSDYLEGLLPGTSRAEFEAHLADCFQCRELMTDVRSAMELCRSADDLEPAPWLVSKVLLATVGERKRTLRERLAALFRPVLPSRGAYAVGMAVFSFSIIVNAAGINLRRVTAQDLNPLTWAYRAYRSGNLLYARVEKFYSDLRVVYEIESRFRKTPAEPQGDEKEAPKQESPPGGSTDRTPAGDQQLASAQEEWAAGKMQGVEGRKWQ